MSARLCWNPAPRWTPSRLRRSALLGGIFSPSIPVVEHGRGGDDVEVPVRGDISQFVRTALVRFLGLYPKDFYRSWPVPSDLARHYYRCPALTFPVLAPLQPPGHEMYVLDGLFDPIPMKGYLDRIRWADVVGLSVTSDYVSLTNAVAIAQIKRINPRAFVIVGGHHAAMFPERFLDLGADLVVKGEAESVFPRLLEEISGDRHFDEVPGVVFRQDGEVIETVDPPLLPSLDDSPHPDWDVVDFSLYPAVDGRGHVGSLECSRGCAFRCSFCAVPAYWRGEQRYKSVGRVIEEVGELTKRGVRTIFIVDDSFGNDEAYAHELVEALIRFPVDLTLYALLRIDLVLSHPELIDRLARAGLKMALIGFESLNPKILKKTMKKGMRVGYTLEGLQAVYRRFRENGVLVTGFFISGHPDMNGDDHTSYLDARTVCDDPRMAGYRPFPGTTGFRTLAGRHAIKDMFFHDSKLRVFDGNTSRSMLFNILNLLDLPRTLRMITTSPQSRGFLFQSHWHLLRSILGVDRRRLRDFRLLTRGDMTSDEKQQQLFAWYLDDPKFQSWLDGLTGEVWL